MNWIFKRRRYLLSTFQYQLIAVNVVYFVSIILVFAAVLFVPVMLELDAASYSPAAALAADQFLSLHSRVWPAAAVLFLLLVVHSVVVSHRIAGPLYRFRGYFKAVAGGNLADRVTIRKHDYLQEEADAINAMTGSLRERLANLKARYDELRRALNELTEAAGNGSGPEISRSLKLLQAQVERFEADIHQFRTERAGSEREPASRRDSAGL